ncbi:MAG TPA: DUF488 domain-containing protein [Thermomicrobiales bacterium]|nr:DUF488 domain-containing protein [Thermomicrobiales bacterium]
MRNDRMGNATKTSNDSTVQTIYTIGHSTRPIEEFIDLLQRNGVSTLVDIRTIPKSRRNPQYWHDTLVASLEDAGIVYRHLPGLGGRRKPLQDSINTAWRNHSFRGYADHMQTEEFHEALGELIALGAGSTTAIMCSEAMPWRCHRSLVGDALLVREVEVLDIISATSVRPHLLTPWAEVQGRTITYPGGDADPDAVG